MGDQRLANYATNLKNRGVNKTEATRYLERYGYTPTEVKSAIRQAYGGDNKIFLTLIIIGLIGTGIWIWTTNDNTTTMPQTTKQQTITLNIETPTGIITPGEQATITANIETPKKTIIKATIEIRDETGQTIHTESAEKEARGTIRKKFTIPTQDLKGEYKGIITITTSDNAKTSKEFILNIKNPDDTTSPDTRQTTQTNDPLSCGQCISRSACTTAKCIDGKCITSKTPSCCGNLECENGETTKTCPQDCTIKKGTKTDDDIINEAITYSKTDMTRSKNLCASLTETKRDKCLSEIAKETGNDETCGLVNSDEEQGACYISIVLKYQKVDVCQNIRDIERKDQCTNLANLLILQQTMNNDNTNTNTTTTTP